MSKPLVGELESIDKNSNNLVQWKPLVGDLVSIDKDSNNLVQWKQNTLMPTVASFKNMREFVLETETSVDEILKK